jgi:cytoskeletal protein CcmA (bactofilin family)
MVPGSPSEPRSTPSSDRDTDMLAKQLDRLGMDDELGKIVREGLARLPDKEQAKAASDLTFALDSLAPAIAHLEELNAALKTAERIGPTVLVKGVITASEDLTIEGQVEGKIELAGNVVTVGASGRIRAQVSAKSIVILGEVTGNVTASDKVEIGHDGSLDGDIASPRIAIAEGAHFRGNVDMPRSPARAAFLKTTSGVGSDPAAKTNRQDVATESNEG